MPPSGALETKRKLRASACAVRHGSKGRRAAKTEHKRRCVNAPRRSHAGTGRQAARNGRNSGHACHSIVTCWTPPWSVLVACVFELAPGPRIFLVVKVYDEVCTLTGGQL